NTPDALAAIFEFVKEINPRADAAAKPSLQAAADTFDELAGVLGLLYNRKTAQAPEEVQALVAERTAAKKAKDWARADALRARISALGWTVTDTAQGPQLCKQYKPKIRTGRRVGFTSAPVLSGLCAPSAGGTPPMNPQTIPGRRAGRRRLWLILAAALALRLVLAAATQGYPYDMSCFVAWGDKLLT